MRRRPSGTWVLSWTQSRVMLPGWYGTGAAFEQWVGDDADRLATLQRYYEKWPFFRTVMSNMSEALAGEVAGFGIKVLIVEPGPFRTDFAGRSIHHAQPLAAYDETPAGLLRARFADQDQRQPNDPRRAAQIILRALDDPEPPLRLPLGPEAIDRIREKLRVQCADIDRWEPLARDTRYLGE